MRSIALAVLAFSIVIAASDAVRAERWVVVNGVRLAEPEIMYLEQVRCGPIPNGNYWLDMQTGIWGYAGDGRPQGHIKDACYGAARRPSLSERGMLFSPYDFVR